MGSEFDLNRLKSVENFYAAAPHMWIKPQKADEKGVLPPIPVDNCVENVDFRRVHALYIQAGLFIFYILFLKCSKEMCP